MSGPGQFTWCCSVCSSGSIPAPESGYPATAELLLLQAGVCSVCTPGPAVLQSPAAQQLPQAAGGAAELLWAGG